MNKGADSARGDDAAGLKTAVVGWLRCGSQVPEPALESRQKAGRGFYHDATARLICPFFFFFELNYSASGLNAPCRTLLSNVCGLNDLPWSRLSSGARVHRWPGLVRSTQRPLRSLRSFYPSHLTLRGEFEKWRGVIKRLLHGFCANEISSAHEGGRNRMGTRIKCERPWWAVTAELLFASAPLLQILPGARQG